MTENNQSPDVPVKLPPPCDVYEPANTDTLVIVKFVGNTPQIQEMRFIQACAEHLEIAGERLQMEYKRLQAIADHKAAQQGILTASDLPGGGLAKA